MSDPVQDPTQRLGGDSGILEDLLGEQPAEQGDEHATSDLAPAQERERTGGLAPLIKRKRKDFNELQAKIANHRETKAYQAKGEDGRTYFDSVAFQEDQARLITLNMEIQDLKEREQSMATTSRTRQQTAVRLAEQLLARELPRVRESHRQEVRKAFGDIFRSMTEQNTWAQSAYADRNAIMTVLNQIFDTAYGHVLRRATNRGSDVEDKGAPPPSGYDADDDPQPPKADEEDEDDFTSNLLYAFDRVKNKGMSVAEQRRRAQAAQKGTEQ